MPKKTRKEKILAQHRRHTSSSFVSRPVDPVSPAATVPTSTFQFTAAPSKKTLQMISNDNAELAVIKTDLARTLILAIVAIGIELAIYWLLNIK